MAQPQYQLNQEVFCCSICLDLLKDPVTTSCGHSYCRICIKNHWDKEDQKGMYTCPYCSQFFIPRPVLGKNTMLAELVEEMKKIGLQAAPADLGYAGAGDVSCDVCTGRKLKAQKSCLQCLASFCEEHLQPHFHAAPFKKHKLVEPSRKLQENTCSLHDEVMKMFCRTDQQSICYLCSVDQHRGHDTVSAAAERAEKQRELHGSRQNIQQKIQHRERDVKLLQQEVDDIICSADKAVEHSEKIFTELIRLVEQRRSDVKQQVRSQQQTEVSRVRELQEKLEQEITELRRKDNGLERLVYIEDHNQFLQDYHSLSKISESSHSYSISQRPLRFFEEVTAAVSKAKLELQESLREKTTTIPQRIPTKGKLVLPEGLLNIPQRVTKVADLPPKQETTSRAEFLQYSRNITLDPNTAYKRLLVFDWDKKVKLLEKKHSYPRHADRFKGWYQVLSREGLIGRCYWEVECGEGVYVAVAYKSISRSGGMAECVFGHNSKSWALFCSRNGFNFMHMNITTSISGPRSSKIGVYLDHRAGILSFYSVSETMTLLHRVQTTFTEPLYAGIRFFCSGVLSYGSTAELCELR